MHSRTIDEVTGWETVATPAGYEGLRRLADREFSGAVSAGPAWAFLLNGRIVGVFEGAIEDFEDADATAYRAADPSLPLLFAMQERGGETRANYYTNETPLRDVDRTLSNGGFTGYVELSENVLSGDYYVVYHGGKSMSVAFVGSSERLVTGEEAFETAADEVGIYEVVDVGIDLVEIPDPEPEPPAEEGDEAGTDGAGGADTDASGGAAAAAGSAEGPETADRSGAEGVDPRSDSPEAEPSAPDPAPVADPDGVAPGAGAKAEAEPEPEPETGGSGPADGATAPSIDDDPGAGDGLDPGADPDPDRAGGTGAAVEADAAPEPRGDAEGPSEGMADTDAAATGTPAEDSTGRPDSGVAGRDGDPATGGDADAGPDPDPRATADIEGDGALADERRWQQARTIPSLDPAASPGDAGDDANGAADDDARERTAQMQRQRRRRRAARDRTGADAARESTPASASEPAGDSGGVDRLRERLSTAKERIESLEAERDSLRAERAELVEERDALRSERAERAGRIEELEAERDRLREEVDRLQSRLDDDGAEPAGESMSPDRALSGTNLFVRYDSKGQATLKHAHAGEASRSDVGENLRLEHHTTFEAEGVTVEDRPYEEFLRDSTEHAFARWVVSDLLYEIGETGNRSELAGVFDAIPDIDRVELHGTVGIETADGVEQRSFDVVFRDRMGDPLFVADINPSRDATTEAMVGSLVENTHTVATEAETLAAGLYVTESFYEPGALETVADRTGGGLLSRSKKRSFVKLSRKRGYHLCLVEARDGEFHLNVPEL